MGGDEGFEGGDGDVASQVTVNIGGQEYTLEPAEDELGGDEGFEGDMGGAEGGFDDAGLEGQDLVREFSDPDSISPGSGFGFGSLCDDVRTYIRDDKSLCINVTMKVQTGVVWV